MTTPKILAFAASTRTGSFNQQAVEIAAGGARDAGADVTLLSLADHPLPLFDQDLEAAEGTPANALALRQIFADHHALLIASPEYNGFFTPLYKNTIDWLSRPAGDDAPAPFADKVAAVVAASPGGLGGLRGIPHARLLLENLGVLVIPATHAAGSAHESLADPEGRASQGLRDVGAALARTTAALLGNSA